MAIFKGREVQVIGKSDGTDTSPLYTIEHKDGQREMVSLNQIQMTEKEVKESKDGVAYHLDGVQVIKDKDLQDLRDSQDRKKIEDDMKKNPAEDKPVKATTYVKPSEVKASK